MMTSRKLDNIALQLYHGKRKRFLIMTAAIAAASSAIGLTLETR